MKDRSESLLLGGKADSSSTHHQQHRNGIFYLIIASTFAIILVVYLCSYDYHEANIRHKLLSEIIPKRIDDAKEKYDLVHPQLWNTIHDKDRDEEEKSLTKFDITSDDVIVFLHIQNTGGNVFGRHLVEDLLLDRPCTCNRRKKCKCYRPNKTNSIWLFSRWTVGWKCGVHPDWTELFHCVDRVLDEIEGEPIKRRYFYITLLRDPVTRFISEYFHFKTQDLNGKSARHWCGGKEVVTIPKCNFTDDVSLDEFLNCPVNLAINRQTRMLSDLPLVGCYNFSAMSAKERDLIMLTSAKRNLHKMAFFGLTEFPRISQYLFEETFDMMFLDADTHSFHRDKRSLLDDMDSHSIERIKQLNHLDMQLYDYAKELMFDRFERLKHKNPRLKNFVPSKVASKDSEVIDWGEREDAQNV